MNSFSKALKQAFRQPTPIPTTPKPVVNPQYIQPNEYVPRGLDILSIPDDNLWSITGKDVRTGKLDVIEWCNGEEDAKALYAKIITFPQHTNVTMQSEVEYGANTVSIPIFPFTPLTVLSKPQSHLETLMCEYRQMGQAILDNPEWAEEIEF